MTLNKFRVTFFEAEINIINATFVKRIDYLVFSILVSIILSMIAR